MATSGRGEGVATPNPQSSGTIQLRVQDSSESAVNLRYVVSHSVIVGVPSDLHSLFQHETKQSGNEDTHGLCAKVATIVSSTL